MKSIYAKNKHFFCFMKRGALLRLLTKREKWGGGVGVHVSPVPSARLPLNIFNCELQAVVNPSVWNRMTQCVLLTAKSTATYATSEMHNDALILRYG